MSFILTLSRYPNEITLDEWSEFVLRSTLLRPVRPCVEVRPPAKTKTRVRPCPAAAIVTAPAFRCSFRFENGALIARTKHIAALPLVEEIAKALAAEIKCDAETTRIV